MSPLRSTVADVDLDAIAHNLQTVATGERAIAVVKADAYGHGAEAVSTALVEAGAAMLAVFTVDEGVALRGAGIAAPILVLGGISLMSEAAIAVSSSLTTAIWDESVARGLADAAAAAGVRAKVHVKVDTGLTRLGAPFADAARRYTAIREIPHLEVEGIFTHFANADVEEDAFTAEQMARFAEVVSTIGVRPAFVHAANSPGIVLLGRQPICDAVRPGLALYGLHPAPHLARRDLRPAMRWSSRIQRVTSVPRGTGVGYGHEYRLPRDGRIATVPVGYGDGLMRAARHGCVLVRGHRVPLAGRVAMDLVTVDVSELPEAAEGDEVVIIGEQGGERLTAEDLAVACGTNNYEVVTNVRRLVPRRYIRGGSIVATRTLGEGLVWR
jgi:alanine racemase